MEIFNTAKSAALEAGEILKKHFRNINQSDIREKMTNDYLTFVDEEAEKKIIEIIKDKFPNHSILAEESGKQNQGSEFLWIIDPLDGTKNYINGIPVFAVSIALQLNKVTKTAIVYDVMQNRLYFAERGKGAFLNGTRLQVSKYDSLEKSLLATGFPFKNKDKLTSYMQCFQEIFNQCSGVRRLGAAAIDLAYVAAGYFEAFWELGLNPWDMAAGELLITEAGGKVTDFWNGSDHLNNSYIVASNNRIHDSLLKIINKYFTEKVEFDKLVE